MKRKFGTSAVMALCCALAGVGLVGCEEDSETDAGASATPTASESSEDSGEQGFLTGTEQIDVDGQTVNVSCSGEPVEGRPVVFLLHGGGEDLTNLAYVQETLSADGRVCSYDRLGAGASDQPAGPQDHESIGTTLTGVLEQTVGDSPVVLAGHSMGGLIAGRYAPGHEQVAGLVLLDATSPTAAADLADRIPEDVTGPSAELRAGQLAVFAGENPELLVFADGEVASAGDIPVRVLHHGVPYLAELDPEYGEGLEEDWTAGQEDWLNLSSDSDRAAVENAGHYIHVDVPEAAVEAVQDVVTRAAC